MIKTTILTQGNAKIVKGEELGYVTKGIHFAPANLSGNEVCQWRSKGCTASCLNTAGRGQMNSIQQSRIAKTKLFFDKQIEFLHKLSKEISNSIKTSTKKFPSIQFYDYTKSFKRMSQFLGKQKEFPKNYHLTFSRSETNDKLCEMVLQMGGNVAVVFRNELPATWNGYEVVNGDENDLRFLDKQGVVVGLIEKGMAKKDLTGFVQEGSIA
jgi:hypothetical protein